MFVINIHTQTWSFQNPDGFPRYTSNNLPRSLRVPLAIPSRAPIPPPHRPVFVPLHRVLLGLGIRRIPDERHPLVHLDDIRVERCRASDVEVKDPRTGLIPDEEKVFEPFGDEQRVFVAFAFQQCVGRDRRRQSDVVYVFFLSEHMSVRWYEGVGRVRGA